ncbi:IS110 family transposase [Streptomyces spinosirectus]
MRNVLGRKTDVAAASWIAQLTQHGLVTPSFVPPKGIREARMFTHYHKAQIDERGREAQRLDQVLQDAGVQLSWIAADILGLSGRAMMAAFMEGTRDPQVLSDLAKGKIPLLTASPSSSTTRAPSAPVCWSCPTPRSAATSPTCATPTPRPCRRR